MPSLAAINPEPGTGQLRPMAENLMTDADARVGLGRDEPVHVYMWWVRKVGIAMYPTLLRWTAHDTEVPLRLSDPASLVQRTRSAGVVRLATLQGHIPFIAV